MFYLEAQHKSKGSLWNKDNRNKNGNSKANYTWMEALKKIVMQTTPYLRYILLILPNSILQKSTETSFFFF